MRVYYSKAIPKGTLYLMPDPSTFFSVGPTLFRKDPWTAPAYHLDPEYAEQRHRALDHLSDLLDGMCEAFGMSPDEVWREPKWREQWVHDEVRFMAHERLALSVVRPGDYAKVVTAIP